MSLVLVMPAYRRPECVRRALTSLALQTYNNFKTVIVDDCSPEPLEDIANEFAEILDIQYLRLEQNGGPGKARQRGIEWAMEQGYEYVMFMDSDDLLYPQAIARLYHEIKETGCDMISASIWQEEENPGVPGVVLASDNRTWLHGKIFRLSFLKEREINFPPMRTNEDMVFNLCAFEAADKRGTLDEVLYLFKYEANSITRNGFANHMLTTDFIVGLYYVVKYFNDHSLSLSEQILVDCYCLYNYCQLAKHFNLLTEDMHEKIAFIVNQPDFIKGLTSKEWLSHIHHLLGNWEIYQGNNQIIYFNQTFQDWVKEYTNGNSNN